MITFFAKEHIEDRAKTDRVAQHAVDCANVVMAHIRHHHGEGPGDHALYEHLVETYHNRFLAQKAD